MSVWLGVGKVESICMSDMVRGKQRTENGKVQRRREHGKDIEAECNTTPRRGSGITLMMDFVSDASGLDDLAVGPVLFYIPLPFQPSKARLLYIYEQM